MVDLLVIFILVDLVPYIMASTFLSPHFCTILVASNHLRAGEHTMKKSVGDLSLL